MAQKHDTPEYVDAPMTRAGKLELAASRRQIRSDAFTAARWAAVNPILQLGEIGYETDTNNLKVGDGVTEWNSLGYVSGGGGGGSVDYAKTVQRAETMPTADASNAGQQFLYSGESDATYTHGYIYENVATTTSSSASAEQTVGSTLSDIAVDIDTLESFTGWTTDNSLQIFYTADGWSVDATSLGVTYTGTPTVGDAITITYTAESTTYAWTRVDVQPAGATYTAGNGISIDANNEISVAAPTLQNTATGSNGLTILGSANSRLNCVTIGTGSIASNDGVAIGYGAGSSSSSKGTAIGTGAITTTANGYEVAIGMYAAARANRAIQIGRGDNYDANTFKVANANGNFEIMSADGTVPTARLTKVNTTATLAVADWSSNTQTVTVSGVKADSVVFVSPAPASASDYASAGILCTSQGADSLTFSCTQTPSSAIVVNIVCM